jgi:hypothetical protein
MEHINITILHSKHVQIHVPLGIIKVVINVCHVINPV